MSYVKNSEENTSPPQGRSNKVTTIALLSVCLAAIVGTALWQRGKSTNAADAKKISPPYRRESNSGPKPRLKAKDESSPALKNAADAKPPYQDKGSLEPKPSLMASVNNVSNLPLKRVKENLGGTDFHNKALGKDVDWWDSSLITNEKIKEKFEEFLESLLLEKIEGKTINRFRAEKTEDNGGRIVKMRTEEINRIFVRGTIKTLKITRVERNEELGGAWKRQIVETRFEEGKIAETKIENSCGARETDSITTPGDVAPQYEPLFTTMSPYRTTWSSEEAKRLLETVSEGSITKTTVHLSQNDSERLWGYMDGWGGNTVKEFQKILPFELSKYSLVFEGNKFFSERIGRLLEDNLQ